MFFIVVVVVVAVVAVDATQNDILWFFRFLFRFSRFRRKQQTERTIFDRRIKLNVHANHKTETDFFVFFFFLVIRPVRRDNLFILFYFIVVHKFKFLPIWFRSQFIYVSFVSVVVVVIAVAVNSRIRSRLISFKFVISTERKNKHKNENENNICPVQTIRVRAKHITFNSLVHRDQPTNYDFDHHISIPAEHEMHSNMDCEKTKIPCVYVCGVSLCCVLGKMWYTAAATNYVFTLKRFKPDWCENGRTTSIYVLGHSVVPSRTHTRTLPHIHQYTDTRIDTLHLRTTDTQTQTRASKNEILVCMAVHTVGYAMRYETLGRTHSTTHNPVAACSPYDFCIQHSSSQHVQCDVIVCVCAVHAHNHGHCVVVVVWFGAEDEAKRVESRQSAGEQLLFSV